MPEVPFCESHQSLLGFCFVFLLGFPSEEGRYSSFLPPCESLCYEAGIQGCGLGVVFTSLLKGLPTLLVETARAVEMKLRRLGCLAFEVWL